MNKKNRRVPQAEEVAWIGLCPCGCGTYKAVLLDKHDKEIGIFGWDREGWINFARGVLKQIDGESIVGNFCENHTPH